jgi:hypothetical protein
VGGGPSTTPHGNGEMTALTHCLHIERWTQTWDLLVFTVTRKEFSLSGQMACVIHVLRLERVVISL